MTMFKKIAVLAVIAAGFAIAGTPETAEAGHHHRHGHHKFHGHKFHGHKFHFHKPYYGHYDYYKPVVKYYWCDIHGCYFHIDSYGHRIYLR